MQANQIEKLITDFKEAGFADTRMVHAFFAMLYAEEQQSSFARIALTKNPVTHGYSMQPEPDAHAKVKVKLNVTALVDRLSAATFCDLYDQCVSLLWAENDRSFVRHLRELAVSRTVYISISDFGPDVIARFVMPTTTSSVPTANMLIGSSVWSEIISNSEFHDCMGFPSTYEEVLCGRVGRLFGTTAWTDTFRHPLHRCLEPDEILLLGHPESLGRAKSADPIMPEVVVAENGEINWLLSRQLHEFQLNSNAVSIIRIHSRTSRQSMVHDITRL